MGICVTENIDKENRRMKRTTDERHSLSTSCAIMVALVACTRSWSVEKSSVIVIVSAGVSEGKKHDRIHIAVHGISEFTPARMTPENRDIPY